VKCSSVSEQIDLLLEIIKFKPTVPQSNLLSWLVGPIGNSNRFEGVPLQNESLLLLGRGSGKSTLSVLMAISAAFAIPGTDVVFASTTVEQNSSVVLKYTRNFCKPLREELFGYNRKDFLGSGSTKKVLSFKNGSNIFFVPNREDAVRGLGPRLLICDEVASWPHQSAAGKSLPDFLAGIRSRMLAQHGEDYRIVLMTTPRSASGPVWDLVQESDSRGVSVVKKPTFEMRPNIKKSLFKRLRKSEYDREICCEFCSDEDAPIDLELLSTCESKVIPSPEGSPILGIDLGIRRDYTGFCVASQNADGHILVHKLLRLKIRRDLGNLVPTIQNLQKRYNTTNIFLDQFSCDAIVALLRKDEIESTPVAWNSKSREQAFDSLQFSLEDQRITLPISKDLREEISGLHVVFTKTGNRRIEHSSGHDDLLFSVLLAIENLTNFVSGRFEWIYEKPDIWQNIATF